MRRAILPILALAASAPGCGGAAGVHPGGAIAQAHQTGDRQVGLTLYRDAAMVTERWRVPLRDGTGAIDVPVDAGIGIDDIAVIDTGGARLVGLALRTPGPDLGDTVTIDGATGTLLLASGSRVAVAAQDQTLHVRDAHGVLEYRGADRGGLHAAIALEGTGPEAWIELTYATPRISWSAAYALIRDASATRAELDGAVAIVNKSGVGFAGAAVTVVDETLAASQTRAAAELAKTLIDTDKAGEGAGRELGIVDVDRGQTRLALAAASHTLELKEILVFDPIGTKFDATGAVPQKTRDHGLDGKPSTTVLRSFEIQLDPRTRHGLPAGPLRLFGRGDRGELVPLGAGRLFDRAQGEAKSATVAVGRSPEVTARRQRTDFFLDDKARRLVEEFTIIVDNTNKHPVSVLVREHMYRGETWHLAYSSPAPDAVTKEGPQQVAMRVDVPASGHTRLVYRVVYTW